MSKEKENLFQYNSEWFEFNFINQEFLETQLKIFTESENKDIEHYKWSAYIKVVKEENFKLKERKIEFLKLIEHDPNEHLWKGAIAILIEMKKFDQT